VPGAYVAGWIKRGPTGFIGTNKSCSLQTVHALVADFNAGELADPAGKPEALDDVVRARRPDVVDSAGWSAIDAAEIARGSDEGRPRSKFTDIAHMLEVAATAPPAPRRGLLARLRG
jgi:ferredoxin--NADP+ reductase